MKAVDAATLGGLTLLLCLGISIAAPQTARSGIEANAVQAATTLPACCAQHPSGEKEFQTDSFAGFFGKMFDTSDYPARWYCGNWTLDVGWLHILSDIGIFVAYLSIASLLIFLVTCRKDVPLPRIFWLFAAFIGVCGFGHLLESALFWWPAYRFAGVVKAATALISLGTLGVVLWHLPLVLRLPSAAISALDAQRKEQRLKYAIGMVNLGCWEWHRCDNCLTFDARASEIFGVEPGRRIPYDEFLEWIHPEDRDRVLGMHQMCLTTFEPGDLTFLVQTPTGAIRHVQLKAGVILNRAGKAEQCIGILKDVTDRMLQDAALHESEANYRTTFEQVAVGVANVSPDGMFVRVNKGLCDLLGYTSDELLQLDFQQITHPDDLNADLTLVAQVLNGEIPSYRMEKRYIRKDGEVVWANLNVSMVRDREGAPKHFISVVESIQERKEAEAALQTYNNQIEKLSLVASKTQHSVVITDAQGRIEWVNEAFTRLTEYTLDDCLGKIPGDLLQGPNTDPDTVNFIHMALRENRSIDTEIINYSKSGDEYWICLKIDPVFNDNGELTNFIATQVDVTDRKRAEETAARSQKQFEALLKADILGIMTCRYDGRIEQANDEFLRIVGYTRDEFERGELDWRSLTPERWLEKDQAAIEQLRKTGAARPWEKEYRRKDGIVIPVYLGVTLIEDNTDLCLCFVLDATAQKRTEASLEGARRSAEAASKAKSDFLASMSHELRTPLNGVIGMTELLANTDLDARQTQFVRACKSSGESLLALINDVLDFSKIEAGRLELDEHEFDLMSLLDDLMNVMGLRVSGKDIQMLYRVDHPHTLLLRGDSHRLRQVLVNLIGNAIKFTERGKISLRVEPLELTEDRAKLRFAVKDTGIGIPADRLDRLFKTFTQVDSSITRTFGGTGLGLCICKSLVEAMGGEMGVDSIQGVGSEFYFTLELTRVPADASRPMITPDQLPRLAVLLVGQNSEYCRFLQDVFESWSMQVETADNTLEAESAMSKALATQKPFDLLVLPGNDQAEEDDFTQRLREHPLIGDVPVFLMVEADDELAPHPGLYQHLLRKPVGQSHLLNAIVDTFCQNESGEDNTSEDADGAITRDVPKQRALNVLLVEDNETNRLFGKEIAHRQGWNCELAFNGVEGVEAVERGQFDVILMDCQMPEMDGFTATRQIRQRESLGQISGRVPIIALTANAIRGDREACIAAGMDDYVSKPFTPAQLVEAVERVLKRADEAEEPFDDDSIEALLRQSAAPKHSQVVDETLEAELAALTKQFGIVDTTSDAASDTTGHTTDETGVESTTETPEPDSAVSVDLPFDTSELAERCLGDIEFAQKLLQTFERTGKERVDVITSQSAAGDAHAVGEAAHALKGAAGIVAAKSVHKLAAEVEMAGKAGQLDDVLDTITTLQAEVDRCLGYLKDDQDALMEDLKKAIS